MCIRDRCSNRERRKYLFKLQGGGNLKSIKLKCSDEIDQNIGSVGEMADRQQTVLFTSKGGAIVADPGGVLARDMMRKANSYTTFRRDRGTYTLDMWVPQNDKNAGQGTITGKAEEAPKHGRDDMDIDAVLADKCLVPAEEYKECLRYRQQQSAKVFTRPA